MKNEQMESYTEILTILDNMEEKYQKKIPKKLIEFFEKNSAKDYTFNINLDKPLKDQKLKNKTLSLLAMLNLNYWCETEEEKQKLIQKYSENQNKYQEELRQKYNPNNIFKTNKQRIEIYNENESLVEYKKQSIIKRLFERAKEIFKLK